MIAKNRSIAGALQQRLLQAGDRAGGWGYEAGRTPRLEPTCWALLALGTSRQPGPVGVLAHWPSVADALVEQRGGLVNWSFHALALWTQLVLGEASGDELESNAGALVDARGIAVRPSPVQRQNSQLQGWSWIDGTFSWVEPTAWALLALKKCRANGIVIHAADERIHDGEALLKDRMCATGGWNYGNSNVFGKDLPAHVPATAIALLALQDRQDEAYVRRSCTYLEEHAATHRSTRALALSALALGRHRRPAAPLHDALHRWLDQHPAPDVASTAMALCALNDSADDTFTLSN